jgi:glycosyltransferase 2 family protein
MLRWLKRMPLRLPGGLRPWVGGACVLLLGLALVTHGREVLALAPDRRGWGLLLLGLGFTSVAQWSNALAWWGVLGWLGCAEPMADVLPLYVRTTPIKYLPGGVWHLLGRLRWLQARGRPGRQALAAVVLDPLLMAVAALALVPFGGLQGGLGLVSPMALLLLRPRWLQPVLQRLIAGKRRLLQDPACEGALLAPADWPWTPLLLELPFLGFRFAGFACCLLSFSAAVPPGWGPWLGSFALAWTAGLVVPGAPGGLGVFELVLLARLRGAVPTAELLAVLVSYRLISVLAEGLAAAAALLDDRLAAARNNR